MWRKKKAIAAVLHACIRMHVLTWTPGGHQDQGSEVQDHR